MSATGNARTYFTGIPCPRGHVAERRTYNNRCVECLKVGTRKWVQENAARNATTHTAWLDAHPASKKYNEQMQRARKRGIEWLFTLESWVAFWGDRLHLRGRFANDLCCARKGDVGPYSPENCEIITNRENAIANNRNRAPGLPLMAEGWSGPRYGKR